MAHLNPPIEVIDREDGRGKLYVLDTDDLEEVVGVEARGDFLVIGWSYEQHSPNTYVCRKCGADRFLVGTSPDALVTVLKCPNCGWERSIHEG